MNPIEAAARSSPSPDFRRLNPELFREGGVPQAAPLAVAADGGGWAGWHGKKIGTAMNIRPTFREGKLGKTEQRWLEELKMRQPAWIGIQCFRIILARRTTYCPDFWSLERGELIAWEVKGHWEDDARVKIKTAAAMLPFVRFRAVCRVKGQFQVEEIQG